MTFPTVLICGTNDTATACSLRLFRAGFKIILANQNPPLDLHQHRTFTRAVFTGSKIIENVAVRTMSDSIEKNMIPLGSSLEQFLQFTINNNEIPLVLIGDLKGKSKINADYVLNLDDSLFNKMQFNMPEEAVRIGFEKAPNVHYLISKTPGFLGRVIYPFSKEEHFQTIPKENRTKFVQTIKAPLEGVFQATKEIGQIVFERDELCKINEIPILSPAKGVITGALNSGLLVEKGQSVIEVSPKILVKNTYLIPQESFAIAGGVLEAICYDLNL